MATKKITGQSKLAQTTEAKADSKERLDLVPSRKKPSGSKKVPMCVHMPAN